MKHLTLCWLGNCLSANGARGKMWTSQMGPLLSSTLASDGFMLNLGSTLLRCGSCSLLTCSSRLCKPLVSDPTKMERVDPSYVAKVTTSTEDSRLAGVHLPGLAQETCIVPTQVSILLVRKQIIFF